MPVLEFITQANRLKIPETTVLRGTMKNTITKCQFDKEDASIVLVHTRKHLIKLKIDVYNPIELMNSSSTNSVVSPIIKILGYQVRNGSGTTQILAVVTEWCDASLGDLLCREDSDLLCRAYDIKQKLIDQDFGLVRRLSLLQDFVRGIELLHDQNIAHGDIHSANLWIRESLQGTVAGFALSHFCKPNDVVEKPTAEVLDMIRYPAPEMTAENKEGYDPCLADVYGIGVLIAETLSMKMAWRGRKKDIPALNGNNASIFPPELEEEEVFKDTKLKNLLETINMCLALDPKERPTLEEIKIAINESLSQ